MNEQEAIKQIRNKACNDRCKEIRCDDSCMYGNDKCAFGMAIKALEKQIPKKPFCTTIAKDKNKSVGSIGKCPCCNYIVAEDMLWCDECGQKLDWSE